MVKFMKKRFLYKILFIAVIFLFAVCKDPIYHNISQEEEMLEPKIKGSPTNFVEFDNHMYVASGDTLYRYDGTNSSGRGIWTERRPGAEIFALAATSTHLYALCKESSGKSVIKTSTTGNNNTWSNVAVYEDPVINKIYAAGDQLFIGAGNHGSYYILCGNNRVYNTGNILLNGAAFDGTNYFLSAKDQIYDGGAIYMTSNPSSGTVVSVGGNYSFAGIINTGSSIFAITRDGNVHNLTTGSKTIAMDNSRLATGGLAVWEKDGNRLILAGRQDRQGTSTTSGYSHGYVEARIEGGNITGGFDEPGKRNISTVTNGDNGRYRSTIGRYPVNHLFQASDGILFASTPDGVFSYRNRKDGWNWNAED